MNEFFLKLSNNPKILYFQIIKKITNIEPIISAKTPDLIESAPKPGPTVLSSIISKGAGKAPDLRSKARSVADWKSKSPEICPVPVIIASLITCL